MCELQTQKSKIIICAPRMYKNLFGPCQADALRLDYAGALSSLLIIAHTLAAISVGAHTPKVQIALRSSRNEMAKLLQVLSSCTSIMVFGIVRNEMKR